MYTNIRMTSKYILVSHIFASSVANAKSYGYDNQLVYPNAIIIYD